MRALIILLFFIGAAVIIFKAVFGLFSDIIDEFGWILGPIVIIGMLGILGSKKN